MWNYKTLVEPYEKAGHTSPKWDEPAKRALTEYARTRSQCTESNEDWGLIISTNCGGAVDAGCDDPLIRYLYIRFCMNQTNSPKAFADAFCKAARDVNQSSYPSIRKFYASLRAVQQLYYAFGAKADRSAVQAAGGGIKNYLVNAIRDETMPLEEAYDACHEGIVIYRGTQNLYEEIEKPLFDRWPDKSEIWLLKGEAYTEKAWQARGSGYADAVTKQGWGMFSNHLAIAENALTNAWNLNPNDERIPLKMLTVELGQGQGRDRMEIWFNRAMAIDPNDYDACKAKLYYLEPKWYGSADDLLGFGWECAQSKAWRGKVPLILLDAHEAICRYLDDSEKTNYWKQPDVWLDIQVAFDRFFELNPDAIDWYHNYAWYAYRCERWKKLNELIPKLGPVNYSYFGGKDAFDKMVSLARAHAGDIQSETLASSIELKRLVAKIHSGVDKGKINETDFADELKAFDTLLAKHKDEKTDAVAQILFTKAMLYLQLFDKTDKGVELIKQLKTDFPDTTAAQNADQVLTAIQKQSGAKKINDALVIGTTFPDFNEKDLAGQPLSIANYKGRVMLVDFWATWCGPCVAELPNVVKTYEKYHSRGFEIIGISLDVDRTKLAAFTKGKNMTWPQYFDGLGWGNKLAVKYGIKSIPATFLLDGNGKIIGRDLRGEELGQTVAKAVAKN
ncbi:MAG: TlpA disulfide reductase family protein [Verrucomicrobiota bacterium]